MSRGYQIEVAQNSDLTVGWGPWKKPHPHNWEAVIRENGDTPHFVRVFFGPTEESVMARASQEIENIRSREELRFNTRRVYIDE